MSAPGPTTHRLRTAVRVLLVVAAATAAFAQQLSDPTDLQNTGIVKLNAWIDYVRSSGDAVKKADDLASAESDLKSSYDLFLQRHDPAGASLSAIKLADVQRSRNRWAQAVPIYKTALQLAQQAKSNDLQTRALTRLAYAEQQVSDTASAVDHIREAVRLGSRCVDRGLYLDALVTAGQIETTRGNLVAAGDYLDRALALSNSVPDAKHLYLAYTDRGDVYYHRFDTCALDRAFDVCYQLLELSRADYQKAIALSDQLGYTFISSSFQGILIGLDQQKVTLEKTQQSAQTLSRTMFSPLLPSDVLVNERFTPGALDANSAALAEQAFQQALASDATLQKQGLMITNLNPLLPYTRGLVAQIHGADDEALRSYMEAVTLVEKDRRELPDEKDRTAFMDDKIDCFYSPALLLLDHKRYPEAFALFERSRSRGLADLLANRQLTLGTPQERTLFSQLQTTRSSIAALQEKLFNLTAGSDRTAHLQEIAQLEAKISPLQDQYDATEARIAKDAPRLKQLTAAETVSLAAVQSSAARNNYDVLYYAVRSSGLVLWHIGGNDVEVKNVFLPQSELSNKAAVLRNALLAKRDAPTSAFDDTVSRQLFLYLIQPVLGFVKTNHLIIIPDEELNSIPFQALENPGTQKYLGESFAITYAPSATVLAGLDPEQPLTKVRLLAVADPELHDGQDEVTAIGQLYPGRSKVVTQYPVSKSDLVTWVSAYNVVHLSVHGTFKSSDPLLSYLQLKEGPSDDGRLSAADMFGLPLQKNSLIVLSACETGRVQATHSNEALGMVRSLLYAGAGNLVLSSWEVNAGSTKVWMETFYREAQTQVPAEAARRALIAVKSRPEYNHPFFWAAFAITGK